MNSAFKSEDVDHIKKRIETLSADSKPLWGTMSAAKMLAHCNVTYELVYSPPANKPNFFFKLMLMLFVKKAVVGDKPYSKNLRTAPYFMIQDEKQFEEEKTRSIEFLEKTLGLGEQHFEQKESYSFGKLSSEKWSNMFMKHWDHHLSQFGV